MEIKNVEDCFKFRLLRKISPDIEKSRKSLELADEKLKEAKLTLRINDKINFFSWSIVNSYMVMFHSARALLYKDGIQEKSHFAVYIYLKEKYSDKISIPVINLLNIYRTERHEALYGLEFKPTKSEAEQAIKDAEDFFKEIKRALNLGN